MTSLLKSLTLEDSPSLVQLCTASLPLDPFSEDLLAKRIFRDTRYDPLLTIGIKHQDRLIGAIVGVVFEPEQHRRLGWIKLLAVHPDHQNQGIGSQLLAELEMQFRQQDVSALTLTGYPCYFWPGIDIRYAAACRFFETQGFIEQRQLVNMTVDLYDRDFDTTELEQQLSAEGFQIHRIDPETAPDVKTFVTTHWSPWASEPQAAMENDPPSLFFATYQQRIVAYAAYDLAMFPGTFGSMGTDPDFRNRRLGVCLLRKCLADMKQLGYRRSEIAWVGPVAFYDKNAGAAINRVFRDYRKTIK